MAIYAYADETIFDIDPKSGVSAVGYGVFVSQEPIEDNLVSEAFEHLKADVDFDILMDGKTIENGYFHASEDSRNAHSHICTAIRKYAKGRFLFTYFTIADNDQIEKNKQLRFFNSCLNGSSIEFFNSLEKVHLTIEGRSEINETNLSAWRTKIYELFEGLSYNTPYYKTYFPIIDIQIANKKCPGLQVTDFLSWATARRLKKPDAPKFNIWFNRLKFVMSTIETTEDMKQKGITGYLNIVPGKWEWDYPQKFTEPETNNDIIDGYILIERLVRNIDKLDFNERNIHLWEGFKEAKELCISKRHFQNEDLRYVARSFIRIFDSLPVYKNIADHDEVSWRCLFHAKYVASLLIRREYGHMIRTQNFIQRWRYDSINNNLIEFMYLMK